MTHRLALAAVLLASLSRAAEPPGDSPRPTAGKERIAEDRMGSFQRLLAAAAPVAKQWSPEAALYSVLGTAPGNAARYSPDRWELFFGDPKAKDGFFQVVYENGDMVGRRGVKGGVQVTEQFQGGKLTGRQTGLLEWSSNDYADCKPIAEPFLDTPALDKKMRKVPMHPDDLGRFRVVLLRPRNDNCDGFGFLGEYVTEKPIPKAMRGKTLWIVTGPEETVFFEALTGKALLKRVRHGADGGAPPGSGGSKGP